MRLLVFTYIFGPRDLPEKIILKIIINAIEKIRDKTANTTQDQKEFER